LGSLRREEPERLAMLEALGTLYTRGAAVNWGRLVPARARNRSQGALVPLSAHSPEALRDVAGKTLEWLKSQSEVDLDDLAYSASLRRGHHDHRLAMVAHSEDEAAELLQAFLDREHRAGLFWGHGRRPRLAYVFSGQGPQWSGMGRQLLAREPVFRAKFEECDDLLRRQGDWSLLQALSSDTAGGWHDRTDIAQPLLFSIQVALVALWRSWGIVPDAVVWEKWRRRTWRGR
jgi:acyl transferase domain-containing protein